MGKYEPIDTWEKSKSFSKEINVNDLIVEELEKIWDKIRALPDINPDYSMDKTIHISRYEVQKIIYERLAELKGEQE